MFPRLAKVKVKFEQLPSYCRGLTQAHRHTIEAEIESKLLEPNGEQKHMAALQVLQKHWQENRLFFEEFGDNDSLIDGSCSSTQVSMFAGSSAESDDMTELYVEEYVGWYDMYSGLLPTADK